MNGVCFNPQRFNTGTHKIFDGANQKANGMFRSGGGSRIAAIFFASELHIYKRGGVRDGGGYAAVVYVCHV